MKGKRTDSQDLLLPYQSASKREWDIEADKHFGEMFVALFALRPSSKSTELLGVPNNNSMLEHQFPDDTPEPPSLGCYDTPRPRREFRGDV